jgi:3-deoxy-D-manno-octulosonic acid kinase
MSVRFAAGVFSAGARDGLTKPYEPSLLAQPAGGRAMFSDKWIWGQVPDGFDRITDAHGRRLVVRRDQAAHIDISLCETSSDGAVKESSYSGRGRLRAIRLPEGDSALIRAYRHGGFFRAVTGRWFSSWPPRPFRELVVTEELRRRGLRTVEVYAACVSRTLGPFYRGWLITRELRGAEDFWSALQSGTVERIGTAALRATAQSIRAMHRQGVYHADLNLRNILLRVEDERPASYIIDYDRARLFLGAIPEALARQNLARLKRSARKLDPSGRYLSEDAWRELIEFYHEDPA